MGVKKESKKLKVAAPKPVEEDAVVMGEQVDEGDQVDQDEAGEWGDNDQIEDTDMDAAEGDMDVEETDPNKLREEERQRASRQEQRQLLKERKTARPNGALVFQLKKLWETIRQKRISPELRAEKMAELMGLITGKIQEVTFRHDAARVIQSALKHGSSTQREIIAQELKGKYAVLACSQYGRFIVSKILNMCPKHRPLVLKEFQGQVRKLMRHRDASFVIEEAYSQFANAQQRNSLMEEFYGPEYALFKADKAKSLQIILTENPEKKQAIIKNIRETISSFLEKGAANIGPHTILHRLILDYLLLLPTPSSSAATKPTESAPAPPANPSAYMVDLLKDHLIHILHTREGSRVAQLILLHATPKDRKHILKSFKGLVGKIAREQHGHTVLLELCSCVDDTVLVAKTVLMELFTDANPGEAMRDPYASRVVLFLLVGRSRRYLVGHVADELEAMDGVRKLTSKKADDVRRKEIVATLSPVWLDLCITFAGELLRSRSGGQVLVEILKHAEGDKTALIEAISGLTSGTIESHALVSTSASATPKKEVFNAAKKLATEAANVKLAQLALDSKENPDLPDMSAHVLVDRNSTFTLKEMISGARVSAAAGNKKDGQKTEEAPLDPSCGAVGIAVATVVSKELEYWLRYCATSEAKTSGTTFVLLALFESRAAGVQDALVGSKKGRKKAFSKLVEELSKAAVVVPKEAEKEAADENAGGKRKRGGGKDLKKSAGARQSVIHIFLNKLKESF
ncbi:pumilio domain member 6 [Chytriomyces hyalinus]|nr:pumilio domain member 6 [Chytriomyces hyalinus]